jgi:NADH-quinone oxidoreductase subunit A
LEFLPVGILFIFAIVVCVTIYALTTSLGPKNWTAAKLSTYESGITPEGNARAPFKLGFYLVAVLFLLFDVEAAFFFPWALVYRESLSEGGALLFAMLVYMFFMVLALVFVLRKNVLRFR